MKLVTRKQMNQIDHEASETYHIPSILLMEHAGHGVYMDFIKRFHTDKKVIIVCGSGNNGGDGFVFARLLWLKDYHVAIHFCGNSDAMSSDTKSNYDSVKALQIPFDDHYENYDIIVDCLFGTGLNREIEGVYKENIEKINALDKIRISIDIPSGVDSDDGSIHDVAIKADITYTMQCGKIGLYLYPALLYCGEIVVVDIFIPKELLKQCESSTYLMEKKAMQHLLPIRSRHSNKGSYGKVLCIGGSDGMSGAISMAAKSALNVGCGLISCAVPEGIKDIVAGNLWESMSILLPQKDGHIEESAAALLKPRLQNFSTILIGCGITRSPDIIAVLKVLLESDIPLVIDADGLAALKPLLPSFQQRKNIIITPHLKEFANLMDVSVNEVVDHSYAYAQAFCNNFPGYTLVLKSETTIIGQDRQFYFNTYGNNGLAVGGSGDVLAGMISGLYAQLNNALQAAVLGVFLHAYSADRLLAHKSVYSIIPTDIMEMVADVMKKLSEEETYD